MSNGENNKEEILAKSRESNTPYNDEGMENAINKGLKMGSYFAGSVIGFPLFFLSVITGQWLVVYALVSLSSGFEFGDFFAKFRFTQQKRYLIAAICFAVLGIGAAILFVINVGTLQGWWS